MTNYNTEFSTMLCMSCNLLVVTKDDFFWQANLKYSGTPVETIALCIKEFT